MIQNYVCSMDEFVLIRETYYFSKIYVKCYISVRTCVICSNICIIYNYKQPSSCNNITDTLYK